MRHAATLADALRDLVRGVPPDDVLQFDAWGVRSKVTELRYNYGAAYLCAYQSLLHIPNDGYKERVISVPHIELSMEGPSLCFLSQETYVRGSVLHCDVGLHPFPPECLEAAFFILFANRLRLSFQPIMLTDCLLTYWRFFPQGQTCFLRVGNLIGAIEAYTDLRASTRDDLAPQIASDIVEATKRGDAAAAHAAVAKLFEALQAAAAVAKI